MSRAGNRNVTRLTLCLRTLREFALHKEQFRGDLPGNDRNRVRNFGREPDSMTIPKPWHAVCIDAKPLSCAEAHSIRKRRFLSKEAPALPLEGCSNRERCPCTYKHHDDRRNKPRRKGEVSFTSTQKVPISERRQAKGRRSED